MAKTCLHAFVAGKVQGVFYRDSTRRKALELEINGWVRNLPDGRVEVLACGDKENLQILQEWLKEGPPAAEVSELIVDELAWQEHTDFLILP
jgi:acylphosphatase